MVVRRCFLPFYLVFPLLLLVPAAKLYFPSKTSRTGKYYPHHSGIRAEREKYREGERERKGGEIKEKPYVLFSSSFTFVLCYFCRTLGKLGLVISIEGYSSTERERERERAWGQSSFRKLSTSQNGVIKNILQRHVLSVSLLPHPSFFSSR